MTDNEKFTARPTNTNVEEITLFKKDYKKLYKDLSIIHNRLLTETALTNNKYDDLVRMYNMLNEKHYELQKTYEDLKEKVIYIVEHS